MKYHHEAKEAMQMMLSRPDILPDIPDKEGKTPLWHAGDSVRKEITAFSTKRIFQDNGIFYNFLRAAIDALFRDDVDPEKSTGLAKTPLERAVELVEICTTGRKPDFAAQSDKDVDSSLAGDVESSPTGGAGANARAKLRVMIEALRPMILQPGTLTRGLHLAPLAQRGGLKSLPVETLGKLCVDDCGIKATDDSRPTNPPAFRDEPSRHWRDHSCADLHAGGLECRGPRVRM